MGKRTHFRVKPKLDIRLVKVTVEFDAEDLHEVRRFAKGFDVTPEYFIICATRLALEQLHKTGGANAYMTKQNMKV